MKKTSVLSRLVEWYESNCNGDWEHSFGIKIDTLDNPGWRVEIDLSDTSCSEEIFPELVKENSEHDWIRCYVKESVFYGFGGARNLEDIILYFFHSIDSKTPQR
jgi:hypothetical protein